jgi:beta propeller repeat protein
LKKKIFSVKLALAIIILALFAGLLTNSVNASVIQFNEVQITTNSASQTNPDIYGNNIVYQDNRSGNWDIYMYTLQGTWTPEIRITTNPANQINPKIYSDTIVYQDDRSGNWDIYLYNISAKRETQITNNTANQENPAIDGNIIAWQDNRDSIPQIYVYNLTSQTEKCISTSTPSSSDLQVASNTNPEVSGNRVVYQKREIRIFEGFTMEDHNEIICYDLATGTQTEIFQGYTKLAEVVMSANDADSPAISGRRIVFESYDPHYPSVTNFYLEWNIRMHDVSSNTQWVITSNNANQQYPDINENQPGVYYIVYQDNRNGNWDIYLFNTDLQTEYKVNNNTANQTHPAVSDGRIVYMDDRNGNLDIYMTTVGYVSQTVPQTVSPTHYNGASPGQALPPQNQNKNPSGESEFTLIAIVFLIAATAAILITSALYYTKRKQAKSETIS